MKTMMMMPMLIISAYKPARDNSLELLHPMVANPIPYEFSCVLRYVIMYVTSKGIRQTVLKIDLANCGKIHT